MSNEINNLKLLLVDDEEDFRRATSTALGRRGFTITEAANGEEALIAIKRERPDIIILDLKMPGMGGIETLQHIREIDASLPVIILTGHGDFQTAIAGIKLQIVDFLQKPVDVEQLSVHIRNLLERDTKILLRERTIAELMVSPSLFPRVYANQSLDVMVKTFKDSFIKPAHDDIHQGEMRSILVYDRNENYAGLIRYTDLLELALPSFLEDSPYSSFFTGMFLAQCKVVGKSEISELLTDQVSVYEDTPIMEAVHLLHKHHLINLPVLKDDKLVGILRARDIIIEIAGIMGN